MPRVISFVVLIAILLGIAILFFRVIANFILPMFIALVLVVMFYPFHERVKRRCRGHDRIAALLTTIMILFIVLLPLGLILTRAGVEAVAIYRNGDGNGPADVADGFLRQMTQQASAAAERIGFTLSPREIEEAIGQRIEEWAAPVVRRTANVAGGLLIGVFVTIVSLYYFLADGPAILRVAQQLLPLEQEQQDVLITQFETVCRAVVTATLLSAVVQGVLAGIGFYVAGVPMAFLLTMLTMVLAMIPFVGAAAVWVPVCLWLGFYEQRYLTTVLLSVYGVSVISTMDNVIKPMVLHGQSNLHPLLALLSVLGGVQALGPIGIFVGPMVVAFLHALLKMFHSEVMRLSGDSRRTVLSG